MSTHELEGVIKTVDDNEKKAVHLRPAEREHLDDVVDAVSSTRTELIRESIYLLIYLWNLSNILLPRHLYIPVECVFSEV